MRGETRQNLIAFLIALGIAALIFGLFVRPAVVLPVGATTLERSIGEPGGVGFDERRGEPPVCLEGEGGFTCDITIVPLSDSGAGAGMRSPYAVEVDFAGCWQATTLRGRDGPEGCINLTDYFGY